MTPTELSEAATQAVEVYSRELDITNADHIALWLDTSKPLDDAIPWLACRIVEAHEIEIAKLRNALRTNQLVERDGVAGVVMNLVLPVIDAAIGQAQTDERFDRVHCLTGVRKDVFAALTDLRAEVAKKDAALGEPQNFCEMPEVAAMRYIEKLRSEEGDSVTILCDDPEAMTRDLRLAVECNGGWTNWQDRRFYGESIVQCLARAVAARTALEPKP